MSMRRLPGLLMAAAALAGCTTPATRVVLLPQEGEAHPPWWCAPVAANRCFPGPTSAPPRHWTRAARRSLDQVDPAVLRAENPALFELAPAPVQHYTIYFDAGTTLLTAASQLALDRRWPRRWRGPAATSW